LYKKLLKILLFMSKFVSCNLFTRAVKLCFDCINSCRVNPMTVSCIHFDVRISAGSDRNVVVRNSFQNGAWGAEDRVLPYFPFMPNASFDMIVLVEQNQFKVMIKHYYRFVCMYYTTRQSSKSVGLVQRWPHHHLIDSNLFSPWYGWKHFYFALNSHSLTSSVVWNFCGFGLKKAHLFSDVFSVVRKSCRRKK